MGENKAFLRIDGERPDRPTVRLFRGSDEVIIVTATPDYLRQEAIVVTDLLPDKGALGDLHRSFLHLKRKGLCGGLRHALSSIRLHRLWSPRPRASTSWSPKHPRVFSRSMPFTPVAASRVIRGPRSGLSEDRGVLSRAPHPRNPPCRDSPLRSRRPDLHEHQYPGGTDSSPPFRRAGVPLRKVHRPIALRHFLRIMLWGKAERCVSSRHHPGRQSPATGRVRGFTR